jgi:hypothetical protein
MDAGGHHIEDRARLRLHQSYWSGPVGAWGEPQAFTGRTSVLLIFRGSDPAS